MRSIVLACVVALTLAVASARANLIVNGGFETGDFSGWTQSGNPGFTFVTTDPNYVRSGTYAAQLGPVSSLGLGFLSQTINVTNGDTYTVQFDLKNGGVAPNLFQLSIDGVLHYYTQDQDPFDWTHVSLDFTATGPTADIEFGFSHDPSYWGLDNVSVNVPEPTSLALIGVAAGLLTARRRAL